ncbi:5-bromo-4-chloroindolyl phosphate hydrolysis family protein [Pseudotabrizicola sp. L79]|uniref:5-bromo-4-chloroindolyl phosphate hydrolysis family protein n=1 Tax=Pseudotabrizicola sp. L79 TaxID=3118402 RepID=UPI002F944D5A
MAQRFGGKYSPDAAQTPPPAAHRFDNLRPVKAGARSTLLFFVALFFLPMAFTGSPRSLLLGLCASAVMLLGAWLTREGLLAQAGYEARAIARRPAIPRKIFGAVLTGLGLGLGALMHHDGLLYPVLFGILGAALHLGSFGLDPLRDKGAEGIDSFQTDRVARAVDEAEKHLSAMRDAILRARDRQLEARVDRFAAAARGLFRTVEQDPRDLTAARKYLSVYLMGARDATVKFADLYAQTRDAKARADYETLLTDLETTFADRSRRLLDDNRSDMNVEIDVLRERLQRET